ncbi:MAG: DUF86 domain-containing protein [Chloroflexia bacterium]|nr:DUF86 domain-containing protein [Chloroflexia bacterium]
MRLDAVVRNLEVIGEAAKNLPQAQRDLAPTIAWRKIAGLRDIVAHQYFGLNLTIIWDVVQHRLGNRHSCCPQRCSVHLASGKRYVRERAWCALVRRCHSSGVNCDSASKRDNGSAASSVKVSSAGSNR